MLDTLKIEGRSIRLNKKKEIIFLMNHAFRMGSEENNE